MLVSVTCYPSRCGLYPTKSPNSFKPISVFLCDAKLLASGNFALPNAKNTNMLVSLTLGDTNFLCWPCTILVFCVDFIPFPVEYRWRWVPNATFSPWACTFHVVYVNFIWAPNASSFFSGIWALHSGKN